MSVNDRLQLIEAIWQTLDENSFVEDEKEIMLLEKRLEEYNAAPEETESWKNLKDRLTKKINGNKQV